MAVLSQTPTSAAPQSLASRGRRPALIPHNADLSISLSAASTALGMASYSPSGNRQNSGGVLWIVPGSSATPLPPSPQWDEPTEEGGRKPTASWDQEEMDIDEKEERESVRELIAKDLFSWVNSDSDNEQPQQQQQVSYLGKPSLNTSGPDTAPTSPLSGNFPEQLEFRRRRLEEAARAESK